MKLCQSHEGNSPNYIKQGYEVILELRRKPPKYIKPGHKVIPELNKKKKRMGEGHEVISELQKKTPIFIRPSHELCQKTSSCIKQGYKVILKY